MNRKEILIISLWACAITATLILTYYSIYLSSAKWRVYKIAWHPTEGPSLNIYGMSAIFISSMLAGIFIGDSKTLLYGLISTLILSFIASVLYGFTFIWFILGYSANFSAIPYGWEWILYMAFLNCFRMFIPATLLLSIAGAGIGSFSRSWIFNL